MTNAGPRPNTGPQPNTGPRPNTMHRNNTGPQPNTGPRPNTTQGTNAGSRLNSMPCSIPVYHTFTGPCPKDWPHSKDRSCPKSFCLMWPYFKNVVNIKTEPNNFPMPCAQMVCYHVYVPLLLRLSNDIEENPGPININEIVDPTYTVCADFHQGNESIFGSSAGQQCVAMSIYAIL